jgi:stage III sporulation protein AD
MAAALLGSAAGLVIKRKNPEMSLILSIAVSALALFLSMDVLSAVLDFLKSVAELSGIPNAMLGIVLKTVGISIITKITADICRESGQGSAATGVEFLGAVLSIYIALPLFRMVLDMLTGML